MGRRRRRPPACRKAVAYLSGANRTREGPKIHSELDEDPCQTVPNATKEEMESLVSLHDRFPGECDGTPAHRSRNQSVRKRTETGSIALTIRRVASR